MSRMFGKLESTGFARWLVIAAATIGVLVPQSASAQSSDAWKGTFAPLYLWATKINGDIATRAGTVPVFMSFADAADNLAGAFSFHFEAEKNRFGIFSDLNFVRLSTESDFTLQGPLAVTVTGDADVDNTFFEAGGSYRLTDKTPFAVIAGLRTFTLSTSVEFSTPNVSVTPIDANRTAVSGFAGFTFRPPIKEKLNFLSRADIGGGSGKSWSAMLGVEFRPKPWAGLVVGYKAMGIDFGKESDDKEIRKVSLTYYGPIFGLNLHWGGR
jgi:hypothetical protein